MYDKVRAALAADGWKNDLDVDAQWKKRIVGFAPAGAFAADGARVIVLMLDDLGRYLERVDGWGEVEKDVDLRDFDNAADAIAAVLA